MREAGVGSGGAELAFPQERVLVFLIWGRAVYQGRWGVGGRPSIMACTKSGPPLFPPSKETFCNMKCCEDDRGSEGLALGGQRGNSKKNSLGSQTRDPCASKQQGANSNVHRT